MHYLESIQPQNCTTNWSKCLTIMDPQNFILKICFPFKVLFLSETLTILALLNLKKKSPYVNKYYSDEIHTVGMSSKLMPFEEM